MRSILQTWKLDVAAERSRLADYLELSKPEVTSLILVATAVGFCAASSGQFRAELLAHTLLGTLLVAAGTAALNQFFERDADARMRRTDQRPLPAGRMAPGRALAFGVATGATGVFYLATTTNRLAAGLALLTMLSYLLLYTPLKAKTPASTTVGAFPGAAPPLIGLGRPRRASWSLGAWVLYAILFLWQFPHFLAIAWMYREDYRRAGFLVLPVLEPNGVEHRPPGSVLPARSAASEPAPQPGRLGRAALSCWSAPARPGFLLLRAAPGADTHPGGGAATPARLGRVPAFAVRAAAGRSRVVV